VNVRDIPGLDHITYDAKSGLRIGSNVTLAEIENSATLKTNFLALQQAAAKAATPQLRNMSTLGGNLGQRTRCWYFRSADHPCFRKGGSTCYARNGENEYHAVLNNGGCCSVHASSVATALLAFGASIEIMQPDGALKTVPIDDFFVTPYEDISRENVLKAGEIITAVTIASTNKKTKSYYIKQGARASFDWALADVAVVAEVSGNSCKNARVALGAASPVPIRAGDAEQVLNTEGLSAAEKAGEAAMSKATPLEKNGYKVPIFKAIVKRAINNIA
jgi:xanthine dehydrogenase YagS FAD-binding subunit